MTEARRGEDATVATTHYERLRADVIAGNKTSGLGLVVLVREGVAAWLALPSPPTPSTFTALTESIAVSPIVSDDIQAEVICVLANMAMAISTEVHA